MGAGAQWGPLSELAGTWEGDQGLDVAFGNVEGGMIETPFRERSVFNPFGPVENGSQVLYGLDYRTSAWKADEENPFHTEVGYWLWDAREGVVMRCFMVPRGSTILAGGSAGGEDAEFTMRAEVGSDTFGILSNPFLHVAARSLSYEVTVRCDGSALSYREVTIIEHAAFNGLVEHVDSNVLHRAE